MTSVEVMRRAMARGLMARKEHGGIMRIVYRYAVSCADLSKRLDVKMDFLEMGIVGRLWLEDDPVHKTRVLLGFWREMTDWLLLKATKSLTTSKPQQDHEN